MLRPLVTASFAALLLAPPAAATPGIWEGTGPSQGTEVVTIGLAPSAPGVAYASYGEASNGPGTGVYRTDDDGATWAFRSGGLPSNFKPQSILVDPTDADVAYAALPTVYRTEDGGATWTESSAGLPPEENVNSLVFDPRDADTIYATAGGVHVTRNGAATWADSSAGLPADMVGTREITVSPQNPDRMYVAVLVDGTWLIYRSDDAGATWERTPFQDVDFIYSVEAAPSDADTVYLSMKGRVMRSTDGAVTWTEVSEGLPASEIVGSLAVDPAQPAHVLAGTWAGMYESWNAGANWELEPEVPGQARSVTMGPGPGDLWVGTCCGRGGVFRSHDRGATWTSSANGFPGRLWMRGIATAPSDPGVVYATSYISPGPSVYRGTESGRKWTAAAGGIPSGTSMSSIAVSPANPDVAVAGAYSNGVYRTTDGGKSWVRTSVPGSIESVAYAPSNPQVVFAGGSVPSPPASGAISRSTDGGQTWTTVTLPTYAIPLDIAVDPTNASIVYAAASYAGVLKSVDGGATWLPTVGAGVPARSIAIDPSAPGTLYAVSGLSRNDTAVFKSTTGGLVWTPTGLAASGLVVAVEVSPSSPQTLVASLSGDARLLVRSTDGGATWTPMSDGLDPAYPPVLLAFAKDGKRLYAGTYGRSVFGVDL